MRAFKAGLLATLLAGLWLLGAGGLRHATAEGIVETRHNLSASGPGDLIAPGERRVCIFCHASHHSSDVMPLWSRDLSSANYTPYDSSTLQAQPGQPTGGSRLCLSCHDGTIALGMLRGGYSLAPLGPIPALRRSNLQTDLSDDHPISFVYDATLASQSDVKDPGQLSTTPIRLEGDRLECTTCHDPHKDPWGMFLVMDNTDSALCEACHEPTGWTSAGHRPPNAACESCHVSHRAGMSERLLREATEEDTCLASCHNGVGPGADIAAEFARTYIHPVDQEAGVHQPAEGLLTALPHVECADCHNPHQLDQSNASAPQVSGAQVGVRGINTFGIETAPAVDAYEICFRCHADNSFVDLAAVPRAIEEVNERLRFDPNNPSFHPVTSVGVNTDVPSLRADYSEASRIYCHDCHNSDATPLLGGIGANGPHGSSYEHLLLARYENDTYPLPYVESNYGLCFRCHDPSLLFDGAVSTFGNKHQTHVKGAKNIPCSVCHDPHGVPVARGATPQANAHLINFDTRFVDPATAVYDSISRSCSVSCHTKNPKTY